MTLLGALTRLLPYIHSTPKITQQPSSNTERTASAAASCRSAPRVCLRILRADSEKPRPTDCCQASCQGSVPSLRPLLSDHHLANNSCFQMWRPPGVQLDHSNNAGQYVSVIVLLKMLASSTCPCVYKTCTLVCCCNFVIFQVFNVKG